MILFDNSIRNRLLLAFLFFSFLIVFLSGASFLYLKKVSQLNEVKSLFSDIESNTLHVLHLDHTYFQNEVKNQEYYLLGESDILSKREELYKGLSYKITEVKRINEKDQLISSIKFEQIINLFAKYDSTFTKIQNLQLVRGFKDAGLEGNMRNFAHELESNYSLIPMEKILMLRRHEKDFFLRGEYQYVQKFNQLVEEIQSKLSKQPNTARAELVVANYKNAFNRIVSIDRKLGVLPSEGLKGNLNRLTEEISFAFNNLSSEARMAVTQLLNRLQVLYTLTSLICILLSILFSYTISKRLAKPIQKLAKKMGTFIIGKEGNDIPIKPSNQTPKEIRNLTSSYLKMIREIRQQYHLVQEKTDSLQIQNEELKKLNGELDRFIYSTSHDLRSPLASLLGLINLTKEEEVNIQASEYLELMSQSVGRLDSTISEIVGYYKNKNSEVELTEVFPSSLTDSIIQSFKFQKEAMSLQILNKIPKDLSILVDQNRLKVILENLISNGIRYQDKSKDDSKLIISSKIKTGFCYFEVKDNGVGIEAAYHQKIFNMFFRASEQEGGSGLGLFLVAETAKKLQGEILLESQKGVGSTFTLKIPMHIDLRANSSINLQANLAS